MIKLFKKIKKTAIMMLVLFFALFLTGINHSYALERKAFEGKLPGESSEALTQAESVIEEKKANLKENYKKMSSDLVRLVDNQSFSAGLSREQLKEDMQNRKQLVTGGQGAGELVHVYIQMNAGSDISAVKPFVNKFENLDENNGLAAAWVDVSKLDALSSLANVRNIRTVIPPVFYATSEGDSILQASTFRRYEEVDGTGIKVGVISDGVDHWQNAAITDDLPDNLHVLRNTTGGDEGTAMLEIIHDLAPGAELYFHDCGDNVLEFNAAVDALINAGCNVICDDIGWPGQPYFEDGIVAQHIASAIASNNIVYVSSAGNSAYSHYQGTFYNNGNNFHDFSQGSSGYYKKLYVNIPVGGSVLVVLQWDDQFGHAANDYDLYLNYLNGLNLAYSNDTQNGNDDPLEAVIYTNNTGGAIDVAIDVKKRSGSAKTLEVYIFPSNGTGIYTNNMTAGDSIFGHAAVPGVISVGAIDYPDVTFIADYSSRGPVTINYPSAEIRNKPDLCGLAGVSVTGAGGFSNPFYGTSAAAPHVAAIAALIWSQDPVQTADQVRSGVITGADDFYISGYDTIYGFGRVNALGSIATPELVIESMNAPGEIRGTAFVETDTVKNLGTAVKNAINISYYFSADGILDGSDICIGQREITGGLSAKTGSSAGTVNLTIPEAVSNGDYYLYELIDPAGIINEINKKNNSKAFGPITININRTSIISTVAGNGESGYSGDGAAAISGNLSMPSGVAFDSSGNMYIADYYNSRIRKVDTSGIISTIAGNGKNGSSGDGGDATSASLYFPLVVTFDSSGNLFIADYTNNRIRKVDTSGKISTAVGTGVYGFSGDGGQATSAKLNRPGGIVFDNSGNMYFSDEYNNRIRKVDTSGKINTIAGTGVQGYSGDGGPATLAKLNHPEGLAFDSNGNMFFTDTYNHCIRKIDTSGIITTVAGTGVQGYSGDGGPATSAQLYYPSGIAFDSNNNLYIADSNNHCIRKVDTSGGIITFSGNGSSGYAGDGGVAATAMLDGPSGVTIDSNGNLYIADRYNHCIRKVILSAPQNSSISPTAASFDKNTANQADIPVNVDLNGNTLTGITNNGTALVAGTDYTAAGNVYTISKSYLALQPVGTTTLKFHFSAGSNSDLSITVSDTTPTTVDIDAGKSIVIIDEALAPGVSRTVTVTLKDANGDLITNTSKDMRIAVTIKNDVATIAEEYTVAGQLCTSSTDIPLNAVSDDLGQISFIVQLPAAIDTGDGVSIQVKTVGGNNIGASFDYSVDECFIATAAYGSKLQPAVVLLRQFRDRCLLTNRFGQAFVNFYYHNSPPIAAYIAHSEPLKALVRVLLLPVIAVAYITFHPGWGCVLAILILLGASYRRKVRSRTA